MSEKEARERAVRAERGLGCPSRPDEIEELRERLREAEEALRAIREGGADAVVVSGKDGEQVYSRLGVESVYRLIVQTMQEAAFTTTLEGRILFCNARFSAFVKRPPEQIVGRPLLEFVAPSDVDAAEALLTDGRRQPITQRLVFRAADDTPVPAHVSATVLQQPGQTSLCVVATDLTELERSVDLVQRLRRHEEALRESEERLRLANLQLEKRIQEGTAELAERATQLRTLAAELTLSEQRERRRMAKVLHDHLQQLLAGAKFRTTLLRRGSDPKVGHAVRELEELLDSALDTSRALTVELSPPILRDGTLVDGLEWLSRWMGDRHGLVVVLSETPGVPPLAEDVKVLLFESVRELLFNAVKHAEVRSATVNLRPFRDDDLQIIVTDSGRGFDPAKLDRPGEAGGGFGLFGIRERLSLVGGKMQIDSVPGKGTRVTLTVPVREAALVAPPAGGEAPQPAPPAAPGPPPKRRAPVRVLLADDHAVVREGLRLLLELQAELEIVGEARDGHAAVEMAGRLQPDVVLMDIGMPNLDGVEATRAIRARYPAVRVIGLSMFQDEERVQAILDAGAVRYLSKSGPPADLIAAVLACAGEEADAKAASLAGSGASKKQGSSPRT